MQARNVRENEAGFATIALVLVLVPMILVIGSYLQTMTERNQRLGLEIREEQAMFAAESGIDYALNEARRGTWSPASVGSTRFRAASPGAAPSPSTVST